MTEVDYIKLMPYSITALCGILMVWNISHAFTKVNLPGIISNSLQFVGNHTLPILTWHFLMFKLVSFVIVKIYALPNENLSCFPVIEGFSMKGWWLAYLAIGVLGSLAIGALVDKCVVPLNNLIKKQMKNRI